MAKNKERRVFFRVYDDVNLSYEKVAEQRPADAYLDSDNSSQPAALATDLQAIYDVDIGPAGLAFNCNEALQAGDNLRVKMLPLANRPVIATGATVVYCNSNGVGEEQYPYRVGVKFVDMADADRAGLLDYVDRRRAQQKRVKWVALAAAIAVIAAPDVVFDLLTGLLGFLFERFLEFIHITFEFIHIAFEFIESALDHLVEHLFHTTVQQTQVIVFYTLVFLFLAGLYFLGRKLLAFCREFCGQCRKKQLSYWSRKKTNLRRYWRRQQLLEKIKLIVIVVAFISCYLLFAM